MRIVEKSISISKEYYNNQITPLVSNIVIEFYNKGYVKIKLNINRDINRIYIVYDSTEKEDSGIKSELSFEDKEIYNKYYIYKTNLQLKGIDEDLEAKIVDVVISNKISLKITFCAPWELYDDLEEANTEADRIIRSARSKAISERKKILQQVESEFIKIKEKAISEINIEKEKLDSYSDRLNRFISQVAERDSMTKEEELHELLRFLTLYQDKEEFILYKDEESFRDKIKKLKSDIKQYQKDYKKSEFGFDSRIDWISCKLRPEHMDFDSWTKWGTRMADYFDDVASLYVELLPKLGFKKSIPKIVDNYYGINELLKGYGLKLSESYFSLWNELLKTCSSLDLYKRERKEKEREEKEAERERIKAEKEYERAIRQAEKDEATARRKLEEAQKELDNEKENENKYNQLKEKIKKLEQALQDAIERGERAISMAQQTKKGFVYIISNVGSFGDNVYKIGLTRRLDPTERIDELSNASVPFPFHIHLIIESDDAPALEAKLHRIFYDQKMNKTNWRKEFFKITMDDINKVLEQEGLNNIIVKDYSKFDYKIG